MKKPLLFSICLLFSIYTYAQLSLTGTVKNLADSQPIAGVSVYMPELKRTTATDSTGTFRFDNLPATAVRVQFRAIGFKSEVKTIDVSQTTSIVVDLETSSTELEEVLITTNNSTLPDFTPFPAYSISQKEVRKYASLSVMGNLSYQPGVDKISIGNGIAKPVIRGLSFNQILLYGQGTRIENQQWDDHHDLGLSDVGIDNIEIVKGPAALIYGADALGGALIFTDEKPADVNTTIADANLGFGSNTLGINADAGIKSTKNNGFFYGIRVGGASHTSYVQGEKEEKENNSAGEEEEEFAPNSKMMNILTKANVGISKKWGVSKFSYSMFKQQIGIIEDESGDTVHVEDEEEQREREFEAPYQDVTTNIFSLENTIFLKKSKLNINLAYQLNDRKEYEPLPNKQKELAIGLKLNTTTYDVKWTSSPEKKIGFIIGSQGMFSKNTNNGLESLVPDADISDVAGYGLVKYDTKKFNLQAGVRIDFRSIEAESYENGEEDGELWIHKYDNNPASPSDTIREQEVELEKEYTPVSFSIGGCYHVNENFTIKINGATGFTAPNYAQLGTFGVHEGTYRFEKGNSDLAIEQNLEGDLGIIWENSFMSFNISGYINSIENYIYIAAFGDSIQKIAPTQSQMYPVYYYGQGDATISGFEAGFDINPPSLKFIDLKATYAMTKGDLRSGGNLPYIPSSKLIGELKFSKSKMGKLNSPYASVIVSKYFKQNNVAQYELSSDAYTLVDFHVGAAFKLGKQMANVDIYCTNLLNTAYFNQLSLVKYIGVGDMGRNIGVQIHLPLFLKNKN
jgi:iron complex outermembrane receptor protein